MYYNILNIVKCIIIYIVYVFLYIVYIYIIVCVNIIKCRIL